MTWARSVVVACWLVAAGAVAAFAALTPGPLEDPLSFVVGLAVAAVPLALATLVVRRFPAHPIGALLGASGLAAAIVPLPGDLADGPLAGVWVLLYLPLAVLLLIAPAGRPASRGARVVLVAVTAASTMFIAGCALDWAVPGDPVILAVGFAVLGAFFLLLVASAVVPVLRYRRADERIRLQLRWLFVAGASLPLTLLLCWTSYLLLRTPDLVGIGLFVMTLAIPTGATIAILRPGWFDIDRVAVEAAAAGAASVVVLALLSAASAVAGLALADLSPAAALVAAIVLAGFVAAIHPILRRAAGRVVYPERARALAALRQLRAAVDAGAGEPEDVQAVLRETLRDPGLTVAYRRIGDHALVGLDGAPREPGAGEAVRLRGDEVGAILPSPARARRIARAVADAAAPLVDAARLRSGLALASAELAASRERLLRAGYEERRRLERDLHDGAQQRLVALGMALRVLQRTRPDATSLAASLDAAVAELGTAVAELRRIAHGMRPSALDDGLAAALADLVRLAPEAIELDVRAGELPDAVSTTAYYVASEAVVNAIRHAEASRIRVEVRQASGEVRVRIADDGRGGAVLRPTAGLSGLQDRVAALGGRLSVASGPGTGTIVEASLPCGS